MPRKSKHPLFKESTLDIMFLLIKEQGTSVIGETEKYENMFELMRECKNRFRKFIRRQYKHDIGIENDKEEESIPFDSIPTKLLPWIFYGLLLMCWNNVNHREPSYSNHKINKLNSINIPIYIMPEEWLSRFCIEK